MSLFQGCGAVKAFLVAVPDGVDPSLGLRVLGVTRELDAVFVAV